MTSIFDENGKNISRPVIEGWSVVVTQAEPLVLTQMKRCNWVSMTKRETFHKSGLRSPLKKAEL
jgi:hypothetical protein